MRTTNILLLTTAFVIGATFLSPNLYASGGSAQATGEMEKAMEKKSPPSRPKASARHRKKGKERISKRPSRKERKKKTAASRKEALEKRLENKRSAPPSKKRALPENLHPVSPSEKSFLEGLYIKEINKYAVHPRNGLPEVLSTVELRKLFAAKVRDSTPTSVEVFDYVPLRGSSVSARLMIEPSEIQTKLASESLVAVLYTGGMRGADVFGTEMTGYKERALLGTYVVCELTPSGLTPVFCETEFCGVTGMRPQTIVINAHFADKAKSAASAPTPTAESTTINADLLLGLAISDDEDEEGKE